MLDSPRTFPSCVYILAKILEFSCFFFGIFFGFVAECRQVDYRPRFVAAFNAAGKCRGKVVGRKRKTGTLSYLLCRRMFLYVCSFAELSITNEYFIRGKRLEKMEKAGQGFRGARHLSPANFRFRVATLGGYF